MPRTPLTRAPRMPNDERRSQLLRTGIELFGRRPYDQVSIQEIARAAGVSKGLLYHYFPTKSEFVVAALDQANAELGELTAPDPALSPIEQLDAGLDAFLGFVEEHSTAYAVIFRSRGPGIDDMVQTALEVGRQQRIATVIEAVTAWSRDDSPPPSAALSTAVQGWIFFVEGAVLRWIEDQALSRAAIRDLLRAALIAALEAARKLDPELQVEIPAARA